MHVMHTSDFLSGQKYCKASGLDKHGGYHDFNAVNEEDAIRGLREEIDEADDDEDDEDDE